MRYRGVVRLVDLLPDAEYKPLLPIAFKDYEPAFVHVDIKYLPRMPDETEHSYLIAATDCNSRWFYLEIQPDKTVDTAAGFLERLQAALFLVRTVLTETLRHSLTVSTLPTSASRPADTPSIKPVPCHGALTTDGPSQNISQTNGIIEYFNGRAAVVLKNTPFASAHHLETPCKSILTSTITISRKTTSDMSP